MNADCKTSALLTSEHFDRNLHWSESAAVYVHCMICSKSRRLNRQMNALNDRLNQMTSEPEIAERFQLDDAARQRIQQKLEDGKKN